MSKLSLKRKDSGKDHHFPKHNMEHLTQDRDGIQDLVGHFTTHG